VLSEPKHYWVVKNEFQGIDSINGNFQLATVQLDVEDAERYGITYVDKDGKRKGCVICHSSIGSIERWIYGVLEEALKKDKPFLPFWLSPTQIRFIPVDDKYVDDCMKLCELLRARVDIDDRDATVRKKIRDAEREWINMIIVYGEKERTTKRLPVRLRTGEIKELDLEELQHSIKLEMKDYPFKKLSLPILLSKRISFR
jgi:threonyl-tRNA synthetase